MVHRFIRRSIRKQTPDTQKNKYLILATVGVCIAPLLAFGIFLPWKPFADNLFNKNGLNITLSKEEERVFRDFGIEISKLDIKAPIMANVNGDNKPEYEKSLTKGLAHYKGTSLPGEKSNVFVFGHSSSDTDGGRYAKIFKNLDNLNKGDKITVYYKNKNYEYTVTDKKVVEADDLSPLNLTNDERLTLMTCWPIGTDEKRLIVIANYFLGQIE